jgi:hypothetical protein
MILIPKRGRGRPMAAAELAFQEQAHAAADNWISGDWKKIADEAWCAPSWREAAIAYHRDRPPARRQSTDDKLTPAARDIWRAAGHCIRRRAPHEALRTFLKWCDWCGVSRRTALPIFKTIVEKELAK